MPRHRIPLPHLLSTALGCVMSSTAIAADYTITITNLTRGIYFTPLLVAAHSPAASVFTSGTGFAAARDDSAERVLMHSGVITADGGLSGSVLSEVHRWDNPVARFTITRTR